MKRSFYVLNFSQPLVDRQWVSKAFRENFADEDEADEICGWIEMLAGNNGDHFPRKRPIFFLMKHDFPITISSTTAFNCFLYVIVDSRRLGRNQ